MSADFHSIRIAVDMDGLERYADLVDVLQQAHALGFDVDVHNQVLRPTKDRLFSEAVAAAEVIGAKLQTALAKLAAPEVPKATNGAGDSVPHMVADQATGVVTS